MHFKRSSNKHAGRILRSLSLLFILNLAVTHAFGQAAGDFRSFATGAWNNTGTWQTFNGTTWIAATSTPTSADGIITISIGHQVNIPSGFSVTVDQTVIGNNANSRIIVDNGGTLILANGTGNDLSLGTAANRGRLEISGTFRIEQSAVIVNTATTRLVVQSTGIYQHNYTTTSGTIYNTTWGIGSTLEFIGYTTNTVAPANLNQTYSNVIWNCTNQADDIDLDGTLANINGNFTVSSTGTDWFLKLTDATDRTMNIGGNFTIEGNSIVIFSAGTGIVTVNVDGNFSSDANSGTSPIVLAGGSGNVTMNVAGDVSNNNDLTLSEGSGIGTINLEGNFANNAGLITETSSGSGAIAFSGAVLQTFSSAGNFSNTIAFTINSNAIVDMGTSFISGSGTFTLSASAELRVGSPAGISSGTASGNIRVSGVRTYNTSSTIEYNGGAPQVTGTGLPLSVYRLVINNSNGVTLTSAVNITNNLTFQSGLLSLANINLTISGTGTTSGASATSHVLTNGNGVLTINSVGSTSVLFPIGVGGSYNPVTISNTGAIDNISARVFEGTIGGAGINDVVNRTWDLSEGTDGGSDFSITLQWSVADEGATFDRSNCGVGYYDGTSWVPGSLSNAAGSDPFTQAQSGNTQFSFFGVGDDLSPLPVSLLSLSAAVHHPLEVEVIWSTATELNNSYFDVEFSVDGNEWQTHGTVDGAGNSNTIQNYTFTDLLAQEVTAGADIVYYRLKQVDHDGQFEYSWVVPVSLNGSSISMGECTPNPFSEMLAVSYQKDKNATIQLDLIDLNGNRIQSHRITDHSTIGIATMETADLPYGIYMIMIQNGPEVIFRKVIKH